MKKEDNVDERVELSLIDLNVLLHVFSFLDWIDAINLAETSVPLQKVNFWKMEIQKTPNNLSSSILIMIGKHCININELRITHLRVDDQTLTEISSLLSRLKKLRISVLNGSACDLISKCSQLEFLEIHFSHNAIDLPEITLPYLVDLRLLLCTYNSNVLSLNAFLARNSQLEILFITGCMIDSTNIFKFIGQNMPKPKPYIAYP